MNVRPKRNVDDIECQLDGPKNRCSRGGGAGKQEMKGEKGGEGHENKRFNTQIVLTKEV